MASGKGRAKHTTCLIVTAAKKPAPAKRAANGHLDGWEAAGQVPVTPAPTPAAPAPAPKPIVAAIRRIIDRRFGRVAK
jgi:hypothetical protein